MADDFHQIDGTLMVRTLSNKMEGVFKLYRLGDSDIDATMIVTMKAETDLSASISVAVRSESNLNSTLDVKYRVNEHIDAFLDIIGGSYLDSFIEVRPNNRMFGAFEILPAPRVEKLIPTSEDSTTRSRPDLMTINYGDSQKMMVGRQDSTIEGEGSEYLESFIKFNDIGSNFIDMSILERANLRLYYTGDFIQGTNLELHLPNTKWNEYGITHANKPSSSEFITRTYSINTVEKYVEFDIKDLTLRWLADPLYNFGLIIRSNNNHATSFYTREGRLKPSLNIKYITNKVVSLGKAELESTMFIQGVGHAELNSFLEVHSDWGYHDQQATLYVHRYEAPMPDDMEGSLIVTKPDQHAKLTVAIRDNDDISGYLSVYQNSANDKQSTLQVNKPDQHAVITVDPKVSLISTLVVKGVGEENIDSHFYVSRDKIDGHLHVRGIGSDGLDGTLTVIKDMSEDKVSMITVSKPDLNSYLLIRALGEDDLDGQIEVPNYSYLESELNVSRPEIIGFLDVHTVEEKEATLYVKYREYMDAFMEIRAVSELPATIDVKNKSEIDVTFQVNKDFVIGFLYPRVPADEDIDADLWVRQRDASDLNSYLHVGGAMGAYYFII